MLKRFVATFAASLLPACALGAAFVARTDLTPTFAGGHLPVITQTYQSGPVSPPFVHNDDLIVYGDGLWAATRSYPYASPAATQWYASGSLEVARVQKLVDKAFESPGLGQPRFVDLAGKYDDNSVGGGTRFIGLHLETGTMSVTVVGKAPDPFDLLESAIASETMKLSP